jgi:hypothetical protein
MLRPLACVALVACAVSLVVARPTLIETPDLGIETDGQTREGEGERNRERGSERDTQTNRRAATRSH